MKTERKGPTLLYGLIQSGYWMDYLVIASFAALFLGNRGFTTAQIGILTASSSLISCVLQQVTGMLADKYSKVPLKFIFGFFVLVCMVSFGMLYILPHDYLPTFIFYMVSITLQATMSPLINSLCLQFSNNGYSINFGVARSMGSFGYAISAFFMGTITDTFGSEIIIPIYIGIYAVVMLILIFFPIPKEDPNSVIVAGDALLKNTEPSTMKEFFQKYHRFLLLMLGFIFLWFGNNILGTYMIYFIEDLGGTASDMGLTLAVMAFSEIPAVLLGTNMMHRFGAGNMLRVSALGGILKAVLFFVAPNITFFTWLNVTHFFLSGFYQVSAVYYCYAIVGEKDIVKGQAIMGIATTGICAMLANFGGGILIEIMPLKMILLLTVVTAVLASVVIFFATDPNHFKNEEIRKI